jgi:molybdate transport system permease protein
MNPTAGRRRRELLPRAGIGAALVVYLLFLGLPILALLSRLTPGEFLRQVTSPTVASALRLSLLTTSLATAAVVLLGLPVAYVLATREFTGKRLFEILVDLPIVLPPTVAGTALLLAFGRAGLAGPSLSALGITLPFTTAAVVVAQVFVAAPFFVNAARSGFEEVETRYLHAAATLRASPWRTFTSVILPLSLPAILAGTAMSGARALGEFGATIVFAGNLPGRTQTMPLAVYMELQNDVDAAAALSVLLLAVSLALLGALRLTR